MRRGLLFIVSAPSGTGKTTLVERLVRIDPDLVMSRSYTSRPARPGEVDGVDYNFVDHVRFASMVEADEFLEWAHIFGFRYGTSAGDTERHRRQGRDVVLVIDVQGAQQVRDRGVDAVGIFVLPPSFAVLEERLRRRSESSTTEEQLQRRLETARQEVEVADSYDYVVINDDVERCVDQLRSLIVAERSRAAVTSDLTADIVKSFKSHGSRPSIGDRRPSRDDS